MSTSEPGPGRGVQAPRIRRPRSGWTWKAHLALAALACAFAGAAQAQTYGSLDLALGRIIGEIVGDGRLRGQAVLVSPNHFIELGTGRNLRLSSLLASQSVRELRSHGARPVSGSDDEDRVAILRGEWDIRNESGERYLVLFIEAKQLVGNNERDSLASEVGRIHFADIDPQLLEPDIESHGRYVVQRLERNLPGDKYRLHIRPFAVDGMAGRESERFNRYLLGRWRPAFADSRRLRLGGPDRFDGELLGDVFIVSGHIEVHLHIRGSQGQEEGAVFVKMDRSLFPPGIFGGGVVEIPDTADTADPVGDDDDSSAVDGCSGLAGAGSPAEAVKCYAGVLKEDAGNARALEGLGGLVGTRFRDCEGCPELVVVGAGRFLMGSPNSEAERGDDEGPVHPVTIGYAFAVGVYEVTFEEWDACVYGGGCGGYVPDDAGWGRGRRPVVNVSWDDARSYVKWLSGKTGEAYRLLSESEWEYVARGGTTGPFHTGTTISAEQANYDGNYTYGSGRKGVWRKKTMPVGSFPANEFGLHDVHGNVWEWVGDCYQDNYAGVPADGGVHEWRNCARRVLRGGSWGSVPWYLRSAGRNGNSSGVRSSNVGFRVARTLTP